MDFKNRSDFIKASSSEKLTMLHIDGKRRVVSWSLDSGSIYVSTTKHYVVNLNVGTQVLSKAAVVEGTWFYDPKTSKLYTHLSGSVDPTTTELIATFRLFFSDVTVATTMDFTDTGIEVLYKGRILSTPGYKHRVGIEQNLISVAGSGRVILDNNDGGLDSIYDSLIFETQNVTLYSWNRTLKPSDAKIIFKGKVESKSFSVSKLQFTIKDSIKHLQLFHQKSAQVY